MMKTPEFKRREPKASVVTRGEGEICIQNGFVFDPSGVFIGRAPRDFSEMGAREIREKSKALWDEDSSPVDETEEEDEPQGPSIVEEEKEQDLPRGITLEGVVKAMNPVDAQSPKKRGRPRKYGVEVFVAPSDKSS